MLTFSTTVVQDVVTSLRVFKAFPLSEVENLYPDGFLRRKGLGPDQWKIGLRENTSDAIWREEKIAGPVSKNGYAVLEITFSPLGVAHYATLSQGPDYQFQSMLQKKPCSGDKDWKVWHFNGDLSLNACDDHGNLLVTSRLLESSETNLPCNVVQDVSKGLRVFKVLPFTEVENLYSEGRLCRKGGGPDKWKIGLRENLADAIWREDKIAPPVSKESHAVLEIFFSPLGVAHYATLCQGPDYQFQSMLQKKPCIGDKDWKIWHFNGDLALHACDDHGNLLVTSRLYEIV